MPTRFYVDVFCLCCIGIVKEFIIGISNLFILIPMVHDKKGKDLR